MASKRDMEIGREFAGNGASSFDPRDWRVGRADVAPLEPEQVAVIAAAEAQLERAFGKFDRATGRYVQPKLGRAA